MTYRLTFYADDGTLKRITDSSRRVARAVVKVLDERGDYVKVEEIKDITWEMRGEINAIEVRNLKNQEGTS